MACTSMGVGFPGRWRNRATNYDGLCPPSPSFPVFLEAEGEFFGYWYVKTPSLERRPRMISVLLRIYILPPRWAIASTAADPICFRFGHGRERGGERKREIDWSPPSSGGPREMRKWRGEGCQIPAFFFHNRVSLMQGLLSLLLTEIEPKTLAALNIIKFDYYSV